jgi:hypothetical protein
MRQTGSDLRHGIGIIATHVRAAADGGLCHFLREVSRRKWKMSAAPVAAAVTPGGMNPRAVLHFFKEVAANVA